MKRKKITAIMAVIMMAAGLSACSQSNAGLEGKSGIVKDEDSKTESDTGVVDQTPATYVQDAEYVNKDDIVSVDDTIEINGITYKIEKYEHCLLYTSSEVCLNMFCLQKRFLSFR